MYYHFRKPREALVSSGLLSDNTRVEVYLSILKILVNIAITESDQGKD